MLENTIGLSGKLFKKLINCDFMSLTLYFNLLVHEIAIL